MQLQEQYQHYIPQFILRNFSHRYKPPRGDGTQKQRGSVQSKRMRRNDNVLNVVDLASEKPQIRETLVSRWFGQVDMYNDAADAINSKKSVEAELAKLEARTAEILQKVRKAHENGDKGIALNRLERDRLRKFLFIMKYRGPMFYGKYISKDLSGYQAEDKNLLRSYMTEKGFASPRDVWLHNLRAILDLEMDAKGEWMTKLQETMFPVDAAMFVHHVQGSYMAFCTPNKEDDEFILTDQCYNVFEGPTHETISVLTGEYLGSLYLSFHEFGPISPRLIIVLRSFVLPERLEDANPRIRDARRTYLEATAVQFPNFEKIKSILADLPIAKAMNSYARVVNGRLELAPGETGQPRSSDRFDFLFWPIKRKHVDIINSIFFDNVLRCKSIVFRSVLPFTWTLEAYMTTRDYGFKTLGVGEHGASTSRRICLEKLSAVLKSLGSDKTPVWHDDEEARQQGHVSSVDDIWLDMFKLSYKQFKLEGFPFFKLYSMLGKTSIILLPTSSNC